MGVTVTTETFWCEHAWLDNGVADAVLVSVSDGRITEIETGARQATTSQVLRGLVIPGMGNAHSHAFHRALRSRTQRDRGSFWTWRKLMYSAAGQLTPERYHALAAAINALPISFGSA